MDAIDKPVALKTAGDEARHVNVFVTLNSTGRPSVAYIIDITPQEKRSGAMGLIGAAFGMGFIFGSSKDLDCIFARTDGVGEKYTGSIKRYGVDIGFTKESQIVWLVFAPGSIAPASGDGQTGDPGDVLPQPLVVQPVTTRVSTPRSIRRSATPTGSNGPERKSPSDSVESTPCDAISSSTASSAWRSGVPGRATGCGRSPANGTSCGCT